VCQFGNILLAGKDSHRDENIGALRMHANGFGWKSRKTGNVIAISKDDLRGADWIKIPHAYQLKLRAKGGFVYRFSGLQSRVRPRAARRRRRDGRRALTRRARSGQGDDQGALPEHVRRGAAGRARLVQGVELGRGGG
jgi:hypothetical protein